MIKEQYKGVILSNKNIPRLITNDIEDNDIQYLIKMGFGFIFKEDPKPWEYPIDTQDTTNDTTQDTTSDLVESLEEDIKESLEEIPVEPKKKRKRRNK